ncbi:hypothetical protein GBAR_LOCUS14183 [Geodia barretti]|uniref:Uncharacterized protein n=1 Tax=Geodia barretti TaxID=519541 RepID=A0AA35WL52_GEOBA|nr:hypothetical protein GBAR_LOCUS14183 [Geodia barretti]
MRGFLLLLAPLLCVFFPWVSTTSTQTPAVSSQDPCSSVHSYIESHPDCSVYDLREGGCSEVDCHWNNSYIAVDVDECKDPVTVEVNYATWTSYDGDCIEDLSNSFNFFYFYNQSEIVDNYKVRKDTGRYSAILARNASHLGFELYVDRPGHGRQTLVDPVYFPLLPGKCMCDSMKAVAEDMYWLNSSSCNTTDAECTGELLCNLEDSALQQVTMSISQCDNPPTLTLGMVVNGQSYPTELTDNTTSALGDLGVTVIYTVWYYNYSMDIQIVAQSGEAYNEILSRHKIILDLTSCSPPRPLDLSTAPPPAIEFTAPTIPDSSSSYDTCAALQSISNSGTLLCNTIQACTALECDWYSRLEMQVDQCHYPPGIIIIVYDSQNQPSFNRKFNDGSTIVEDGSLPDDLNVTVQQMFPSAISVEVFELARPPTPPPPFNCYSIITKTVIPIDKSSCFTSAPPTTAPTSTCSAMRYVQTALSYSTGDPCFFPVAKNCSILTCPIGKGKDLTLRILRCAHPPAVRITLGTAFSTTFDHTFDHSEVVPLQGVPEEGAALNVTLGQLCSSNSTGLQVSYVKAALVSCSTSVCK